MELSREMIEKGEVTVYNDTDPELVKAVKQYNDRMSECRIKRKRLEKIEYAYLAFTPFIVVVLIWEWRYRYIMHDMLIHPVMSLIILLLNVFAYIYFAAVKRRFAVSTICVALLLLIHRDFVIVLLPDIVLTVIHGFFAGELKREQGYPVFADIFLHYKKENKPPEQ